MANYSYFLEDKGICESPRLKGRFHIYRTYVRTWENGFKQRIKLAVAADDAHPEVSWEEQMHAFKQVLDPVQAKQ